MNFTTTERPRFDEKDDIILQARLAKRRQLQGPLVGDWIVMLNGEYQRFSHDWGDSLQTSEGGSFYLGAGGYTQFSGGLNPSIPLSRIKSTGRTLPAYFWFFHHDQSKAHNGVDFKVSVPVWEVV